MEKKGKGILIVALFALFLLLSLVGVIAFYVHHPSKLKPLIETAVSKSTGARCTIDTISYSFRPLRAQVKGLSFRPAGDTDGFALDVPELKVEMALEGPFARRRLVVERLFVERFSFLLKKEVPIPEIWSEPQPPSFFSMITKRLIAFLFFRDVVFQTASVAQGHAKGSLGPQTFELTHIRAEMNADHKIDLSCRGELDWPARRLHLAAEAIHVTTDQALSVVRPVVKAFLKVNDAYLKSPEAVIDKGTLHAHVTYSHEQGALSFEPLEAHFQNVTLNSVAPEPVKPIDLRVKASGKCDLQAMKIAAHQVDVAAQDLFQVKGGFQAGFQRQISIQFENLDGYVVPQKLLPFLPASTHVAALPLKLSGKTKLRGTLEGSKEPEGWLWRCDLQSTLHGNRWAYETADLGVEGEITGEVGLHGSIPDLGLSLDLKSQETSFAYKGVSVKRVEAQLRLTGKPPLFTIGEMACHVPLVHFQMGRESIGIKDIRAQAQEGLLNAEKGTLRFPEIGLSSSLFQNLRLSLDYGVDQLTLALNGKQTGLMDLARELHLLHEGWSVAGRDTLRLDATVKDGTDWSVHSEIHFEGLHFENLSGTALGQGITLQAAVTGQGRLGGPQTASTIQLELGKGEILFDRFYMNLGKYAFTATGAGDYDFSTKELHIGNLALKLKHILDFRLEGQVDLSDKSKRMHGWIGLPETSVQPLFHHFLLEPFRREKPFLDKLKPGGTLSARMELDGHDSLWETKGHIFWRGELLGLDETFSFHGIDLDLPFWYRNTTTEVRREKEKPSALEPEEIKGHLSVGSVILPTLPKQSVRLRLRVNPNHLSIPMPTVFRVPGGEVALGPVKCHLSYPKPPSMVTSLSAQDMDLAPLLSRFWPRPVQGLAQVDLDPVRFEKNTLQTEGEIKASIFGGEILLSNPGVSGLLAAAPVLHTDVTLEDLHLAELTKETAFGRIQGILEGDIKNLEISYGQPQAFDLRLETRKRPGVPQKISVRAVDNIAQIGGGQSPFVGFASVFASLFKEFPYEKIGIHASLKNDMFRINGTIKEGGKEYLVKRGGFSGVNVVNQNPDNLIRFKDMVKRIHRVTSSKSGPVVR
jgi:hypothetical protein